MTKREMMMAIKKANPGITIRFDTQVREYRVAFHPSIEKDTEAAAYYTNDIDDAANTARAMWNHKFGVKGE